MAQQRRTKSQRRHDTTEHTYGALGADRRTVRTPRPDGDRAKAAATPSVGPPRNKAAIVAPSEAEGCPFEQCSRIDTQLRAVTGKHERRAVALPGWGHLSPGNRPFPVGATLKPRDVVLIEILGRRTEGNVAIGHVSLPGRVLASAWILALVAELGQPIGAPARGTVPKPDYGRRPACCLLQYVSTIRSRPQVAATVAHATFTGEVDG